MRLLALLFGFLCLGSIAAAQPLLPVNYDPSIPTLQETIGHDSGAEITTPNEALTYFETLQAAAPDRMRITKYATSWEARDLVYGVIASSESMARIDEIKADMATLASGRATASEQDAIVARTPAVVWLAYSVHGNEISGTDAGLALAYHLLATEGDAVVDGILENTIVIIDPMQNPDGRNRFVTSFETARGLVPTGDRYAAEHDEPWPGGRPNHYLFDLNRDWFALTQPETRGKVAAVREWNPVALADVHEMSGDSTYFFPPAARPFNPQLTATQRAKQDLFGQNYARWFDREGIEYFTREVYDGFYPGYGDMWPALNGAIAMTFEQGSARGLKWDRATGGALTYRDGVRAHFLSSLSTAETVANNKTLFLNDYAAYRRDAIAEGQRADDRYFIFDLAVNRWQTELTGRKLAEQGIEVYRVTGQASLCGTDYSDGALVIDTAAPTRKLAKTLLAENTPLAEGFIAEQEARRANGQSAQLYDVTAWSVPLMSGLSSRSCARADLGSAESLSADEPMPTIPVSGNSDFAYAVPWTDAGQAKLVVEALKLGIKGKTTELGFTAGGRTFPRGTVVFSRAANPDADFTQLERAATRLGVELVGLSSSWTQVGPNLGSANFKPIKMPRIAMAWGEGVRSLDAGAMRYVLEQKFGVPVTPIRLRTLPRADLARYDVLILPEGRYSGGGLRSAVTGFANAGGVVIGSGSAVGYLADPSVGLLSTQKENAWTDPDAETGQSGGDEGVTDGSLILDDEAYAAVTAASENAPDYVPGVLLNAVADEGHWLSTGYNAAIGLYVGRDIYAPLKTDEGANVFRYASEDNVLASGYLWKENAAQLAFKPFIMQQNSGAGMAIGFTQSPVSRAYLDGLDLVLLNAILLGPAYTN